MIPEAWEVRERLDEDSLAGSYHRTHHDYPVARYWNDDFLAFVLGEVRQDDRILDLGCGPGSLWDRWQKLPMPARLTGVDISPGMIAEARLRWPRGEFVVGRVHELPFEAGSFDVVIASSVLHHVPDERLADAFGEIERVLGEYGRLVGREPSSAHSLGTSPSWLSGAIMNFRHLVMSRTGSREPPDVTLGPHHHVPDAAFFVETLSSRLKPIRIESRFPFSSSVMRARSERVARLAAALDGRLVRRAGSMLYYVAAKGAVSEEEVARCVALAVRDEIDGVEEAEFLAMLQVASERLDELLADDTRR